MQKHRKAGFTRTELIVVCVVVALLALALHGAMGFMQSISGAKGTAMKNRARGIWTSVISANAERDPLGLPAVWPKDLGFDACRTSTEYFSLLMRDDPSVLSNGVHSQICEDLRAPTLGGTGLPIAANRETFTSKNNAWQVICVSTQTPPDVMFLLSRNVDVGKHVNARTPVRLNRKSPYKSDRCFYVTCGGACMDRREKYLNRIPPANSCETGGILYDMGTNTTYDVMLP
ncbi:MAG: hypothetical protein WCR06_02465 [bacterium]